MPDEDQLMQGAWRFAECLRALADDDRKRFQELLSEESDPLVLRWMAQLGLQGMRDLTQVVASEVYGAPWQDVLRTGATGVEQQTAVMGAAVLLDRLNGE